MEEQISLARMIAGSYSRSNMRILKLGFLITVLLLGHTKAVVIIFGIELFTELLKVLISFKLRKRLNLFKEELKNGKMDSSGSDSGS